MHTKIFEAAIPLDFDPIRAAKRMTLPTAGRTLVFDDESEASAFLDFQEHEYRWNGERMIDKVDPVAVGLLPLEIELLEAHRQAGTSFFLAVEAFPWQRQVRLKNLLRPEEPDVRLTDFGLAKTLTSLRIQFALFFRVVHIRDIFMSSGFFFGFECASVPGLLQAYRQKTKKVPPQDLSETRFVFFYNKHRQFGIEHQYQDVV